MSCCSVKTEVEGSDIDWLRWVFDFLSVIHLHKGFSLGENHSPPATSSPSIARSILRFASLSLILAMCCFRRLETARVAPAMQHVCSSLSLCLHFCFFFSSVCFIKTPSSFAVCLAAPVLLYRNECYITIHFVALVSTLHQLPCNLAASRRTTSWLTPRKTGLFYPNNLLISTT